MNLAIVHYHLNRGGVAQVVMNQLRAMRMMPGTVRPARVVLLHGGRRDGWPDDLLRRFEPLVVSESIVPQLEYDTLLSPVPTPSQVVDGLTDRLAQQGCSADNTLLHVHNHALGKNCGLPRALHELALRGFAMLLQIHDFAEDFRPFEYQRLLSACDIDRSELLPDVLYPQAAHIHYAVLNDRDRMLLHRAGVASERLHWLPNAVAAAEMTADRMATRSQLARRLGIGVGQTYVLYPVRAIRRKNIGEMLLWAALSGRSVAFGVSLPPLNPRERPRYAAWQDVAASLRLGCWFETGGERGLSLNENLAACDCVITTSVAEGFGLVFLEGALRHRPLVGRDLPEITADFVQQGITFSGLHDRLQVPLRWLDRDELFGMWARAYQETLAAYQRPVPDAAELEPQLSAKCGQDSVNFGDLDAELQTKVVERVARRSSAGDELTASNPWLGRFRTPEFRDLMGEAHTNATTIARTYSIDTYSKTMATIYASVMDSRRDQVVDGLPRGSELLDSFLDLSRFRPVRL